MEGVKICKGGPRLSHLFFANDSLQGDVRGV